MLSGVIYGFYQKNYMEVILLSTFAVVSFLEILTYIKDYRENKHKQLFEFIWGIIWPILLFIYFIHTLYEKRYSECILSGILVVFGFKQIYACIKNIKKVSIDKEKI